MPFCGQLAQWLNLSSCNGSGSGLGNWIMYAMY